MIDDNTRAVDHLTQEVQVKTLVIERQNKLLRLVSCLALALLPVIAVINIQLQSSVAEKEQIITQLRKSLPASSYMCQVSGPGLQSTTINYLTHVRVELSDTSGQPCLVRQNVTAELRIQSVDKSFILPTTVFVKSPSQYKVSYTALSRGQHKLHVRINGSEARNSTFNITVHPNPTQLGTPVRIVRGLNRPWGIAINSHGEMVVSNFGNGIVWLLDKRGKPIRGYGFVGDKSYPMEHPTGVTIDSDDNVYVASNQTIHVFRRDGQFKHGIQYRWGEHTYFRGITLHHGYVYVCFCGHDRIEKFDTDLIYYKTIQGSFHEPYGLDFDSEGNLYVSERYHHRIKVYDTNGQFVREFGDETSKGNLIQPSAVHILGHYVYVTDQGHDRIVVYRTSGQFVTSFGKRGKGEGEFDTPYGITSDKNGYLYVADYNNDRVQVF